MDSETHVVTGAFGYSGQYIARRLLARGKDVRTLTNSPNRPHDFGDQVEVDPFNFDRPESLRVALEGARVLYNTYWVRFNHSLFTHVDAVANTKILFEAARAAGVERVVHVSITNPSLDSDLEYFRGKAELEQALEESGMSYAILRPTVLFGQEDILVNNIAWTLRRMPCFGLLGDGSYRIQPIHVDDMAKLAVEQGASTENTVVNAIGPETFTFRELVQSVADAIGKKRLLVPMPSAVGYVAASVLGMMKGDVMMTWDEVKGLTRGLLYVDAPPAGEIALTEWARDHADILGRRYASELARRKDRSSAYGDL